MLGAVGNAGMRGCVLTCECGLENDGDANHFMMGMGEYDWYVSWVIMGILYWRFIQLELLSLSVEPASLMLIGWGACNPVRELIIVCMTWYWGRCSLCLVGL